jgi:hypothetical protein
VVVWELAGRYEDRQQRALRLIGGAFAVLGAYLVAQGTAVLPTGHHAGHSFAMASWPARSWPGLALHAALGWWWADPVAGFVLVYYAGRECLDTFGRANKA